MYLPAKAVVTRLLVTVVALAGIALAVRFIVDDRFSRDIQCLDKEPSLLYRAETLAKIAMQCVSDARLGQANEYSYAALRRQPHNQLALAALGSVADLENDPVRADFWFGRAKELGHRDYSVETYWITRSAAQQKWGKVAQHIDALFRAGWKSDDAEALLRQLESTTEGRKAIIAIVDSSPPWMTSYLKNTAELTVAELVGRRLILLDMAKRRKQNSELSSLSVAGPAINALYDRGYFEAAFSLRSAFTPFTRGSLVNDPHFDNFSTEVFSPFDWTSRSIAGIELFHDNGASRPSLLRLHISDPGRYLVVEQTLRLVPGNYAVRIEGNGPGQTESNFILEIRSVAKAEEIHSVRLPIPQASDDSTAGFTISSNALFFRVSLFVDAADTISGAGLELRSLTTKQVQ